LLRARQKLGKFRLEKRIASGPLAVVFQAYDTIHGDRVALKIPQDDARSEFYLQDFRREARLSGKLRHRNILRIRDASIIDGHFVISMPLGTETLAQRLRRRLARETALGFIEQALEAVAYAHEQGVLHCDIKPENFIVFPGNELRLTDFAISKLALETLRASGSGTVGYIAPEQAVGRPMYQSDVFSLGLVVYRILVGAVPEWPYVLPPATLRSVRKKFGPDFVRWLQRSVELRPEKRFRNAIVMNREFQRIRRQFDRTRRRPRREADPSAWQSVLFRQFLKKYRRSLNIRHACAHCTGPVSDLMSACPWCGTSIKKNKNGGLNITSLSGRKSDTQQAFPAECPRCHRGAKLDWKYCGWCYGSAFEVETQRSYPDKRYTQRCSNSACRGELMPYMRYCPWCRTKIRRAWKLAGSRESCGSCGWGVDTDFWTYCPWCTRAITT
jgi:serine/threonine-protein kinase